MISKKLRRSLVVSVASLAVIATFQNCSGGFSALTGGTVSSSTAPAFKANLNLWNGSAFVARGLDQRFTLASHPLFKQFNVGFAPDVVLYVDGEVGLDSNAGTSNAPLKTLTVARDELRRRAPTGDAAVVLRGEFRLSAPFALTAQDSGAAGHVTTYLSDPTKPATLSGARRLTTPWTRAADQTWTMNLGGARPRDLYVNGARATRARSAQPLLAAVLRADHSIDCAACGLSLPSAPTSVEVVFGVQWQNARCTGTLNPDASIVPAAGCAALAFNNVQPLRSLMALENAPSLINGSGQWAFDANSGVLSYRPRAGEDPATAVVEISDATQLITMTATTNLALVGLNYRQTYWPQVYATPGFVVHQADVFDIAPIDYANLPNTTDWMPAAVSCVGCRSVLITECEFADMGASGLRIGRGSKDTLIFRNRVRDVAGSGLQIGDPSPSDPATLVSGTVVEDNDVGPVGLEYFSSPAIFQYYAANSVIQHNEVHDGPYTGISVGWGWTPTQQANTFGNHVNANHVFNFMTLLQDGAGIYLNAAQAGGEVAHNYVHDIRSGLSGINPDPFAIGVYLDNGVSGVHVNNNSISNAATRALFLQNVVEPFALNNVVDSDGVDENTVRFEAGPRALPLPTLPEGARLAFGGMYGYGAGQIYVNPFTGRDACPTGYAARAVLGTLGLDDSVFYCFKVISATDQPAFDFGGMYGRGGDTTYSNPATGQPTCPAGFTANQVLGTTNVDWPLYYCARAHVADQLAKPFEGLYGLGTRDAKPIAFEHPLTGRASCPSGLTATAVFGTTNLDWPVYVCH